MVLAMAGTDEYLGKRNEFCLFRFWIDLSRQRNVVNECPEGKMIGLGMSFRLC